MTVKNRMVAFNLMALILAGCNENNNGTSNKENTASTGARPTSAMVLDRLVGTWRRDDGKSFERWIKISDKHYQSDVYKLQGTDTTWEEQAVVFLQIDNWVFENKVTGQNEGKAVKFTSTAMTQNSVHFSNPAHDFPTDVVYTMPDDNNVQAYIAGPNSKGGKDTIPFNYTRHN